MPSETENLREKLERLGALTLDVNVIPRAAQSEIIGLMPGGTFKVRVAATPEKGKANQEVCELLARYFEVPSRSVEVVLGQTSRHKRVRVRR